ncbi:hypothetical protein MMC32_006327 [Xylographa parallela]|nr:hypothetical protein [Xylographa parallela]
MHLSTPLIWLILTLSTSITASSLPINNLHARDEPAKAPEIPPSTTSPVPSPEVAPPPEAAPDLPLAAAPPPEAAQNDGGDAASADDNSDPGDGGGLDERDLRAREAYAEREDELYVRDD